MAKNTSPGWTQRAAPLLLLGAGTLAYLTSFLGVFVYDDRAAIQNNPYLRSLRPTWPELWTPPETTLSTRPVTAFTLAANYAISGLNVWSYHLFNVAIHVLAGLTLLGISRRALRSEAVASRLRGSADWFALTVALLWVVHPLLTECVTYISTRTESLMGLFFLLTLYCTIRGAGAPRGRGWYAAAVGSCLLGVGSKEVGALAPWLVLLYDRTFLAGSFAGALRRRLGLYLGLAGTWVVLAVLMVYSPRALTVGFDFPEMRPWEYALTQLGVIPYYLWLSVWPHPLVLCYDAWPLARSLGAVGPQALITLVLLAGTLWTLWRIPWLGFLGAWFFLILAPSSSFLPIVTEVAAERRMHLSLIAVLVLVVLGASTALRWAAGRLGWSERLRRAAAVGLVAIAAGAGTFATALRNLDYRSDERIWRDVLRRWPDSRAARLSLAGALYDQDRVAEGMALLQGLLRLSPADSLAHYHLAFGFVRLNKLPEAAAEYARAVELAPDDHKARLNFGGVLVMLGRYAEARPQLEKSLELQPGQPFAHFQLGRVNEAEGRLAEAVQQYRAGLKLDRGNAAAHSRLGVVLAALGRTAEARAALVDALRLQPDSQEARAALATLDRQAATAPAGEPPRP